MPKLIRNLSHLHRDRGYRWEDSDPILTFLRADITDSGWPLSYLSQRSGVSASTLSNWMNGKTKHPANQTVDAVLTALGWNRTLTKTSNEKLEY